jgi:uncharacterized membrane protein YcaP (DUF421 family)
MLNGTGNLVATALGLGAAELNPGQMALRAVFTVLVLLAFVRFGDKRLAGKGTVFDFVVAIMLGSVMSRAITGSSPLLGTWLAGLTLVAVHWLMSTLAYHIGWFGPLVKGSPVLLIEDGRVDRKGMRDGSVTLKDIAEAMRGNGHMPDPRQVRLSYLERDGSISLVPCPRAPRILDVAVVDGVQTVRIAVE